MHSLFSEKTFFLEFSDTILHSNMELLHFSLADNLPIHCILRFTKYSFLDFTSLSFLDAFFIFIEYLYFFFLKKYIYWKETLWAPEHLKIITLP